VPFAVLVKGFPVLLVQQISPQCVADIEKRNYVVECLLLVRLDEYLLPCLLSFCFIGSFCLMFVLCTKKRKLKC